MSDLGILLGYLRSTKITDTDTLMAWRIGYAGYFIAGLFGVPRFWRIAIPVAGFLTGLVVIIYYPRRQQHDYWQPITWRQNIRDIN